MDQERAARWMTMLLIGGGIAALVLIGLFQSVRGTRTTDASDAAPEAPGLLADSEPIDTGATDAAQGTAERGRVEILEDLGTFTLGDGDAWSFTTRSVVPSAEGDLRVLNCRVGSTDICLSSSGAVWDLDESEADAFWDKSIGTDDDYDYLLERLSQEWSAYRRTERRRLAELETDYLVRTAGGEYMLVQLENILGQTDPEGRLRIVFRSAWIGGVAGLSQQAAARIAASPEGQRVAAERRARDAAMQEELRALEAEAEAEAERR